MSLNTRTRPSPAMIVAAAALCFALVGTAVAGTDSVSRALTKSKVKKIAKKQADKQLKANVSGSHVNLADQATNANNANNANNAQNATNAQNAQNAQNANNANNLGGVAANNYQQYTGSIPSGKTVTGAFGDIGVPATGGGATAFQEEVVEFNLPAPVALTSANVNFSPGTFGGDDDAACTGTATNPTAPAGKVCLYGSDAYSGTTANTGLGQSLGFVNASRFGFRVESTGSPFAGVVGTWAYTAP
jgi:hypothetical protein